MFLCSGTYVSYDIPIENINRLMMYANCYSETYNRIFSIVQFRNSDVRWRVYYKSAYYITLTGKSLKELNTMKHIYYWYLFLQIPCNHWYELKMQQNSQKFPNPYCQHIKFVQTQIPLYEKPSTNDMTCGLWCRHNEKQ